jgi:hypothetical protein
MKVPTTIEALLRKPQTRAEHLRDADIHLLIGLLVTPQSADTADWYLTIIMTRFPASGGVESEKVECRNFDEVYEYLANYAKPDRLAESEAEGDDEAETTTTEEETNHE